MKKNNLIKVFLLSGLVFLGTTSCTNLEEQVLDGNIQSSSAGTIDTHAFLTTAYNGLTDFQNNGTMFALSELSTDAMVGPTRGGDWDDNGAWRQIHAHTWNSVHVQVRNTWNILLSNIYNCNQVIYNNGNPQDVSEARFLRAFYYYYVIDFYGQVPHREKGTDLQADAEVWSRTEATTFVIKELEDILNSLPNRTANDASIANKDAAHFLLAKLYLNKGVFTSANPVGPYTFDSNDMIKVVQHVDAISSSLAPGYWDNFMPNNNTSPEILFSSKNIRSGAGGLIRNRWRMTMHYNQKPGGNNGFALLPEYYDRFSAQDARKSYTNADIKNYFGNPVGFQVGQQYAPGGVTPLKDRKGNPLVFTPEISLIVSGSSIETAGIRAVKYVPDWLDLIAPDNDYVFYRYADALLMKAEAVVRGGAIGMGSTPGAIMSSLAARVGVTAAPSTLDGIYAERGRELWLEGWRRNDMIRFETFLKPRQLKPSDSDPKYVLLPIPAAALLNPNLKQNPGY